MIFGCLKCSIGYWSGRRRARMLTRCSWIGTPIGGRRGPGQLPCAPVLMRSRRRWNQRKALRLSSPEEKETAEDRFRFEQYDSVFEDHRWQLKQGSDRILDLWQSGQMTYFRSMSLSMAANRIEQIFCLGMSSLLRVIIRCTRGRLTT